MGPDFEAVDTSRIQILAVAASLGLILAVFELIRRGKLREEYSLLWLLSCLGLLFFSIWRGVFDYLAHQLGIAYSPALLILVVLFFGILLMVHFSIVISRLTGENKRLAQELALLDQRIEELVQRGRGETDEA